MSAAPAAVLAAPRAKDAPFEDALDVDLPAASSAGEPPEARGLTRDGVRLLVSLAARDQLAHATFRDLPDHLAAGDVLVVNASATIAAALDARRDEGADPVEVHLSTPLPGGSPRHWVIELRALAEGASAPLLDARAGEWLGLAAGGSARLLEPYRPSGGPPQRRGVRLWTAELIVPGGVLAFAARYGRPIRYRYVRDSWPLADYQTVFATEPGSAEMPSAGRPFTPALLARLERMGVGVAPLVLHTGVASLEADEPPYPERYRVARATADLVNHAHDAGHRVIAVGSTVVRALETVASPGGRVHPGSGWTDLIVTPDRGVRAVDGIVTGLHEPRSSHLAMLEAFEGRSQLVAAYQAALDRGYLWHEFGDMHMILR